MMKTLEQALDLFPHRINLNYKRKPFFHTIYGKIQSFLSFFVLIFLFYKFSEDLIYMQNPKLGSKDSLLDQNPSERFNLSSIINWIEFRFEVGVNSKNEIVDLQEFLSNHFKINIDKLYFEKSTIVRYSMNEMTDFSIVNQTNLNNKSEITNNNFDKNAENNISSSNYTYNYVVKFNYSIDSKTEFEFKCTNSIKLCNTKELSEFDSNGLKQQNETRQRNVTRESKHVKLEDIKLNDDFTLGFYSTFFKSTNKITLKEGDVEIKLIKKIGKVHILDTLINPDNRTFSKSESEIFEFKNEGWAYNYQIVKLIDDRHFFFSSPTHYYVVQEAFYYQIPITDAGPDYNLDYFSFTISKIMKSHIRTFKKVPNILAELNALIGTLILIGNFTIGKLNKMKFDMEVVNNLYRLDKEQIKIIVNNQIKEMFPKQNKNADNNFNSKKNQNVSYLKENSNMNDCEDSKIKKININDKKEKVTIGNLNEFINSNIHLNNTNLNTNNLADQTTLINLSQITKGMDFLSSPNKTPNSGQIGNSKNIDNNNQSLSILNPQSYLVNPFNNNHQNSDFSLKEKVKDFLQTKKANKENYKLIKFNYIDIIKSVLCLKKYKDKNMIKQEEIISYTEKKVYGYLDVIRLMKLFEKFEKLKRIVLNQNQMCGFDHFKSRGLEEIYKNKEKDLFEFCKYYKGKDICTKKYDAISDQVILSSIKDDLKILL